jgi:hypothetical protein
MVHSLQVGISESSWDVVLNGHQRERIHWNNSLEAKLPHCPLTHEKLPRLRSPNPYPLLRQLESLNQLRTPNQSKGVGLEENVLVPDAVHRSAMLKKRTDSQPLNLSQIPTPSQGKCGVKSQMQPTRAK